MQFSYSRNLNKIINKLDTLLEKQPSYIKNYLRRQRIDLATINLDVNPLTKALQNDISLEKIHALLKNFSTINFKKNITEDDIELLRKKIELNKKLLMEIKNENIESIQHLLVEDNMDLNLFKSDDNPLLYTLKNRKSQNIIELLVQHYIQLNFHQFNGNSPLTETVLLNNKNAFDTLLRHGADVNYINDFEETSFIYLIKNKLMTSDYLKDFLEHQINVNLQDNEGKTVLMYLIENNQLHLLRILLSTLIFNNSFIIRLITYGKNKIPICKEKLEELITKEYSKINIDIEDDMGYTSLMYASRDGNFELASILLNYRADVNKENSSCNTPLLLACENDYTHTAKLLLQTNKVKMNHRNRNGDTELTLACQNDNPELIHLLLEYQSDINIKNDKNYTPLLVATSCDKFEAVKALLEHGADINAEDSDGNTALILACQNQNPSIMELLLEYHSNVHHKNKLGCTALHYLKDKEMIRIILNYKANINERNSKGDSLVNILCYPKNKKNKKVPGTLNYILDCGADINNTNNENENALIIACKNGNLEIIDLLLSRHIDFNHVKNNGDSALSIACKEQNIDIVKRLLAIEGIEVDPVNNEGDSPFLIACQNNYLSIISAFLENEKFKNVINFNIKNLKEDFPLYYAVFFNNLELVKFLLEMKVNMYEEKGHSRFSPFLLACCSSSKIECIKLFIDNGIDINKSNSTGLYPLIQACKSNKINVVKFLLEHGANPNLVCDSSTPLIDACMMNNVEIVTELLKYGADVNLKSNNDMTALIHLINADDARNNSLVQLLIDYGADIFVKDCYGNSLLYLLKNSNKIDKEEVYDTIIKALKKFDIKGKEDENDLLSFIKAYDDYTTVMATIHPNGDNIEEFTKDQLEHAFLQSCIFSNSYYPELFLQKCPFIDINLRETNGDTPLIIASQLGNSYLIDILLRYHADPTIISECRNNALYVSIYYYNRHNDLSVIKNLLDHGSDPNEICQYSYTALMEACKNELVDVVALLLQYHADPNIRNSEGHTALSLACLYGNLQIVKLLLETENIDINNQTNQGYTPLMFACENGFGSVVSLLLQYNANIYIKNHYHQTALHIACNKGLNPIVIQFLEYKKKLDLLDEDDLFLSPFQSLKLDGNTIFLSIVMDYEITYLKTLISYYSDDIVNDDLLEIDAFHENVGENIEDRNQKEIVNDSLKSKSKSESKEKVKSLNKKLILMEHQKERLTQYKQIVIGEYPFILDNNIYTLSLDCLHELFIYSTIFLNTEFIYKFLELKDEETGKPKLNINYKDSDGNTALHYICSHKSQKKDVILYIINLFIQRQADINIQNNHGFTPLMYACQNENEDVVKFLINHQANVNAVNHNHQTALMLSCIEPCNEIINLLIEKGVDLEIQDTLHQDTALTLACKQFHNTIIIKDLIIRGKANINIANSEGDTPLILTCQNDIINIPKLLIDYGADVNARNKKDQSSPLLITINNYNYSMMKYLLDHGADINIVNNKNETPLITACKNNNKYIAEYLIKRKANKEIKNWKGHTAKTITNINNYHYICDL